MNSSIDRWFDEPEPVDPKLSLPGFFFAKSISSRTLAMPSSLRTTSAFCVLPAQTSGWKSFCAL